MRLVDYLSSRRLRLQKKQYSSIADHPPLQENLKNKQTKTTNKQNPHKNR